MRIIRVRLTEKKVRKKLEESDGTFRARLGRMAITWNPDEVVLPVVGGNPVKGPAEVTYRRAPSGKISVSVNRR